MMAHRIDLLKLSSKIPPVSVHVLNIITRDIGKLGNTLTTLVLLQKAKVSFVTFYDETHTTDIKSAIKLGHSKDIVNLKDIKDSTKLLEVYKEKHKLLFVKLSGITFLIKDKNNCGFISSVVKTKRKSLIVSERNFIFESTTDGSTKFPNEGKITIIPVCDKTSETTTERESSSKILPQRKRRGVTKVLPIPEEDSLRESAKPYPDNIRKNTETCAGQRFYSVYNVNVIINPFHGMTYSNSETCNNYVKQSIEATDGATSMPSLDCFASNVGSRYKPTTYLTSTLKGPISRLPKEASRPAAKHRDFEKYENRQETFSNTDWDKYPNRPKIQTLLNWGFFYTGRDDLVRCYQCGIGLKDWSIEDQVRDEHVRHSGDCDFLKQKLGQEDLNRLKIQVLYEADGGFNHQYSSSTANQVPVVPSYSSFNRTDSFNPSSMVSSARSSGTAGSPVTTVPPKNGINKNAAPKLPYSVRHPDYQTMESRGATFNQFPNKKQDPRRLSIAGFFYTGQGDVCRCFCCDGGMQHWDEEDEPVREHAKYFPTCSYIRQIKGDEYIKTVRQEAGMEDKTETLPKNKNAQVKKTPSKAQSDEDPKNKGERKADHSNSSDVYRSKIVQNVLASGFDQNQVKMALEALLKKGIKSYIEDDLVDEILKNQEQEKQPGSDNNTTGGNKVDHSDKSDMYRSKIVQNVLALGFNQNQVKLAVDAFVRKGIKSFTEEDIVNEILENPESEQQLLGSDISTRDNEEILKENQRLKDFLQCMLCKLEEANILFLPCAHHKVCSKCSERLGKCPFCSERIDKKIKTFLS